MFLPEPSQAVTDDFTDDPQTAVSEKTHPETVK